MLFDVGSFKMNGVHKGERSPFEDRHSTTELKSILKREV